MCCKQERKDGTKVKAEVSLKFKAPTDRNCLLELKAVLQSTKTGCTQHKGILLLFLSPSTPCPQTGCPYQQQLKGRNRNTSHKQRHICNQEQIRMSREKKIWDESFPTGHFFIFIFIFYLQQLPKALEICEAPSLFLKTLSLLPFPKPCLQGHRTNRPCFHITSKIKIKPTKIKPNQ